MNDPKDIPTVALPPRFTNPFQGLKGDPTAATVNCLMPKEAFIRVKQCRLEGGTIQTTMNLLWIKLIQLLERKQIYGYDSVREFEDAVRRSVLILPEEGLGGPTESPNPAVNVGNDTGAAESVRDTTTSQSEQPNLPVRTDQESESGGKRRIKSKKGGKPTK